MTYFEGFGQKSSKMVILSKSGGPTKSGVQKCQKMGQNHEKTPFFALFGGFVRGVYLVGV